MPNSPDEQSSDERPVTRSVSERIPGLLNVPSNLSSTRRRRSPTRDERLRSPFNEEHEEGLAFPFDVTTMATEAQLTQIREALRDELRTEVRNELRNETAAAAAAIPDAIRKKPDIPQFDKAHVEIWIKRTENAFIRANIRAVNEKFAFLETKFPVGFDPRIDEFLYGDATDNNWTAFLAYLRKEFGATKQQRAAVILDGLELDGRRPSQFAATLDDKTKDVTMDDVKKEILLRKMPTDIRRMLQERVEELSFKEAAKIADHYFDADGRPKHISKTPTVSHVSKSLSKMQLQDPVDTSEDENPETNAVGFRKKRFEKRSGGQNQQNRNFPNPQSSRNNTPAQTSQAPQQFRNRGAPAAKPGQLCRYHQQFGDDAQTCKQGCPRFPKIPSNGKAGRQA